MMEAVVSNAGPLMVLAKLNLLHLLKQMLRTDIWISPTLTNRLLQELLGKTGATDASEDTE